MMRIGLTLQQGYIVILASLLLLIGLSTFYGIFAEDKANSTEERIRLAIVNSRVRIGWWLIIILSIASWIGMGMLCAFFAIFSFLLLREFLALTPIKHTDHWVLVTAFYVVIPVQYALVYFELDRFFTLFIPVYFFLFMPIMCALNKDTEGFFERVTKLQWGVMISVFCISHAPALATLDVHRYNSSGPLLLVYLLTVVFCTDLFSVLASSALRGRALRINHNKTVKGTIVGAVAGFGVGLALFWLTPFRPLQAVLYSFLIVLCCCLGDIVINAVKHSIGSKSYEAEGYIGRGVIERLAPLVFAAPVFYHLASIFAH